MTTLADIQTAVSRPQVIVLGAGRKPTVADSAEQFRGLLERHVEIAVWDFAFETELDDVAADWVVVFGGDGSILRAVFQMGRRQRPILGVNLGKLGFLADLKPDELPALLPKLCAGEMQVVEHLLLEATLVRDGRDVWTELSMNEIAVLSGPPFVLLDVQLYVDAELATTYSCDGLIVSTPVGSTAHSLSAGGPILRKDLQAIVIVPIGPHALTMRPVVESAERTYELIVPQPEASTHVVIDGRDKGLIEPGDRLRIRRAAQRSKLIEAPGHGYYRTLREKLGWSGRFVPNA